MIGWLQRLLGNGVEVPRPGGLLACLAGPLDPMGHLLMADAAGAALVIDAGGRIVRANSALTVLLSGRVSLKAGVASDTVFTDAARASVWSELRPVLQGRVVGSKSFVSRVASSDGGQDVRITAMPLRESDQQVSGALLRFADISAQRELEEQLLHSQKLQATGQLAAGIAHDFNNLLTAILGSVEGILDHKDDPPGLACSDIIEDAQQIRDSAQRGADLVRQLLAFGRQQTLQPRVLAVNEMISNVSGLLRRLLGGTVRLDLTLEQPGRMVRADPTQLDQVLINLAVNARNAMPDGGVLTLRSGHITLFRPLAHGAETIPPGRYVMIEVQDTGVGIPPELLPRIFDPFFTTRREQGGSGLGLATVHGIIRQSEGFLAVESSVGKGTSLRIYLPRWDGVETVDIPCAPPPASLPRQVLLPVSQALSLPAPAAIADDVVQPLPAAVSMLPVQLSGLVLLVDDEDPVRRLAERAITRAGFEVLSADCGEAALDLLRDRDPAFPRIDAVVTDMMMPGMDGATLLREVRGRLGRPELPAILVSGFAQSDLRSGLAQEAVAFLAKPYTLAELVATLRRITSVPAL